MAVTVNDHSSGQVVRPTTTVRRQVVMPSTTATPNVSYVPGTQLVADAYCTSILGTGKPLPAHCQRKAVETKGQYISKADIAASQEAAAQEALLAQQAMGRRPSLLVYLLIAGGAGALYLYLKQRKGA